MLFVSVLVVHSFHVPSRRDLMFSLAASAGLMAVGGAQAIDLHFGLYVVAWAGFGLWGLVEMWTSASDGGRIPVARAGIGGGRCLAATAAIFLVLPAPTVAAGSTCWPRRGSGARSASPGPSPAMPGRPPSWPGPGAPPAPTRVGGYLGFANSLDTALRGSLGHSLVMRVRAERPSYWVGETFDTWNGESWTTTGQPPRTLRERRPSSCPSPRGDIPVGQSDLQTFYVDSSTADLVFHAESASEVWFPARSSSSPTTGPSCRRSGWASGAIYTVESVVIVAHPRPAAGRLGRPVCRPPWRRPPSSCPTPTPGCQPWPSPITAGATTTYDRVQALIAWIGREHPLLHGHSAAAPGRRHRRRVPLRQPGRVLRADLHVAGGHVAIARHTGPRGRRLRARVRTTRSPTSTRCGPTTPTPGSRCGFPATAGRASIPPRWCRSPIPPPVRPPCGDVGAALRRVPLVPIAAVVLGRRPRRRPGALAPDPSPDVGRADRPQCRAGGPAGGASPPAFRDPRRVRRRPRRPRGARIERPGAGWPHRWRRAPTEDTSRHPIRNARWSARPGGSGGGAPGAECPRTSRRRSWGRSSGPPSSPVSWWWSR